MAPSTPSPLAGKRQSLGLSNKWLYERSRRLSASNGAL
jgi:nucleoporin POM34